MHLFGLLRLSSVVSLFKKSIHFLEIPEDDEPFGDKPKAENSEIHISFEKQAVTQEGAKARRGRQYLKQIRAGPQGPRLMADEGVKGVMMVDSPPHQPQKKE